MSRAPLTRLLTGGLLGLVLAGSTLATAPAAVAAPAAPTVSASPVAAGQEFTVSGTGCTGDSGMTPHAYIASPAGLADPVFVAADGSWAIKAAFPAGQAAGTYALQVVCEDYVAELHYPAVNVVVGSPTPAPVSCSTCTAVSPGGTVAIGEVVVMRLTGYKPYEKVTVVMRSTPVTLGTFTADAAGVVNIRFTVPANGSVNSSHTLTFSGNMGTPDYVLPITLGAPVERLAFTGSDVTVPLALGVGLVLAGGAALVVARRRQAEPAQA